MKIIYLIPPSEGKNNLGIFDIEEISISFKKPLQIAKKASEKDLKCSGKKYLESIKLNKNINKSKTIESIKRYNGIMFKAIGYENMSLNGKKYFEEHFFIFSGMYGILKPNDKVGNYKLPIETKGLLEFWGDKITKTLNKIECDLIIDFLPDSYKKMINRKVLKKKIIEVDFLDEKSLEKLGHNSKTVKGQFIRNLCESGGIEIRDENFKNGNINIFL